MAAVALEVVTVLPSIAHTATVIFIHGLGDSGYGWRPVAEMLKRDPGLDHVKWVLPTAPLSPVTVNRGIKLRSWFDIYRLGFDPSEMDRVEDEQGMLKTRHSLDALITSEVDAGIPANRIVLGGFSQGGAMTVLTGLSSERRLAGLAVLSGWAPMRKTLKSMLADHFKKLPIFWGHGTEDPLVTYAVGKASKEWLESVGIKKAESTGEVGLDFHAYQGLDHSTDEGELEDLKDFLVKVLPKDS